MNRRLWMLGALGGLAGAGVIVMAKERTGTAMTHKGTGNSVFYKLKQRRDLNLERLKVYTEAGHFPTNRLVHDLTPVFFDFETQVACAVGHLMMLDGLKETVQAVASAKNRVRIEDLKDGPVVEWILSSGLTQQECIMIQPSYDWQGSERRLASLASSMIQMHLRKVHQFLSGEAQSAFSLKLALDRIS